jgi:hypothetical protein
MQQGGAEAESRRKRSLGAKRRNHMEDQLMNLGGLVVVIDPSPPRRREPGRFRQRDPHAGPIWGG